MANPNRMKLDIRCDVSCCPGDFVPGGKCDINGCLPWHKWYREMKKDLGYSNADIAKIIGNSPDSVRVVTLPSRKLPNWVKLAIWIHRKNKHELKYGKE